MFLMLILALIGALAVCLVLIDSLWSVLELVGSYLMPYFHPNEERDLVKRFGPWAVVTGSTDGIGKQYAKELAARGLNIVLISRNPDKLQAVAQEIEKEHKVKTKIIVADYSKGQEIYPHIEAELKDMHIGILVNNVGIQYDYPMRVGEVPLSKAWEVLTVNAGSVTSMCRVLVGSMAARRSGAIVNISSGSEHQPLPLMTVYAATKAYIRSFTLALREEYSSQGIYVQHVAPMYVSTKINAFSQSIMEGNLLVPDVVTYTKYAVNTLGRVSNTSGYWIHGIQTFFIKLAPEWLRIKLGKRINEQFRKEYRRNKHKGQ